MKIHNIIEAIPHTDKSITIKFDDGKKKTIDIKPFIKQGISSALSDFNYFKKVRVENGYISWENGFDFCPNFLYNYVTNE